MTKLERFRKANNIRPSDLVTASGLAPRTVTLIRNGQNTTIESAKAIAIGASKLLRREVSVDDLFDLSTKRKTKSRARDRNEGKKAATA